MKQHDNVIETIPTKNPVESLVSDEILAKIAENAIEMDQDLTSGSYLDKEDIAEGYVPPLAVYMAMSVYNHNPNFIFVFPKDYDHILCSREKTYIANKLGLERENITATVYELAEKRVKNSPQNADYRKLELFSRTPLKDMVRCGTQEKFNAISYQNYQKNKNTELSEKSDLKKSDNSFDDDETPSPSEISDLPDSASSRANTPVNLLIENQQINEKKKKVTFHPDTKFHTEIIDKLKQEIEEVRQRAEQAETGLAKKIKKTDDKSSDDGSVGYSKSESPNSELSDEDLRTLTEKQIKRYKSIKQRAEQAEQRAEQEKQRAEKEKQRVEQAEQRAELAEKREQQERLEKEQLQKQLEALKIQLSNSIPRDPSKAPKVVEIAAVSNEDHQNKSNII